MAMRQLSAPNGRRIHSKQRSRGQHELSPGHHRNRSEGFEYTNDSLPIDLNRNICDNLGDILFEMSKDTLSPEHKLSHLNNLTKLVKSTDQPLDHYYPLDEILECLLSLAVDSVKEVRAGALRVCRYVVHDMDSIRAFLKFHFDAFLCISLERTIDFEVERTQALKLARHIAEIQATLMPRSIVASIVAIADNSEDRFSRVCLETLTELAVRCPKIVAQADGFRTILRSILLTNNRKLVDTLCLAILCVVNRSETRRFLRIDTELESVLYPFTDEHYRFGDIETAGKQGPSSMMVNNPSAMRFASSKMALTSLLRSWGGLVCLASNASGIRSLIDVLWLRNRDTMLAVMDVIFDVLGVEAPEWTEDFMQALGRGLFYHRPSRKSRSSSSDGEGPSLPPLVSDHDLAKHYKAALIAAFANAGLVEALIEVIRCEDKTISVRGTVLLGEYLELANALLPRVIATAIQSVPSLVAIAAAATTEPSERSRAFTALNNLGRLHQTRKNDAETFPVPHWSSYGLHLILEHARRLVPQETLPPLDRSRGRIDQMKALLDLDIDDAYFQALLRDSGVVVTKDLQKWNWDIIWELIVGPLRNTRRLEEAVNAKFIKRLLSFFRPSRQLFSEQTVEEENLRLTRTGCALLDLLVQSEEGVKALRMHNILPQIADLMAHLGGASDRPTHGEPLTPKQLASRLSRDYFGFIGVLSGSSTGLGLLEKHNVFGSLYNICQLKERDDAIRLVLQSLDYNVDGHARIILCKILTASERQMRIYATEMLRTLFRAKVQSFSTWGMGLLVTQLYDPDPEVCQKALQIVDEVSHDVACLNSLVLWQPALLHLGDAGRGILLRFLGTFRGLKYLNEADFTMKEMDRWVSSGNIHYVNQVEGLLFASLHGTRAELQTLHHHHTLSHSQTAGSHKRSNSKDFMAHMDQSTVFNLHEKGEVVLPVHYFGELAKTKDGVALIRDSGYFSTFTNALKIAPTTNDALMKLKAALWAVGHIASCDLGASLVEGTTIIKDTITMCESADILSLRGTCYYVLGLMSRSKYGQDTLRENGWESTAGADERSIGICLPVDMTRLFQLKTEEYRGSWAQFMSNDFGPAGGRSESMSEILKLIGSLSNEVLLNASRRTLKKLKDAQPELFQDVFLFAHVSRLMGLYHYHLTTRRFVAELFADLKLTSQQIRSTFDSLGVLVENE
eukprot:Opistho-2@11269